MSGDRFTSNGTSYSYKLLRFLHVMRVLDVIDQHDLKTTHQLFVLSYKEFIP